MDERRGVPALAQVSEASASRRVRSVTAAAHAAVESRQDLLSDAVTPRDLGIHLSALGRVASAVVARADGPVLACLQWPERRRRLELLAVDGARLAPGIELGEVDLPGPASGAALLGWLYVLEGSTLGGSVLERHLSGRPAFTGVERPSLQGYGERTGQMWRRFQQVLDGWGAAHPGDLDVLCAAASDAFAAVDVLLTGATREAVA